MDERSEGFAVEHDSPLQTVIFVWHDRISSITPVVGLLDPEDPLDVDEGTMDDAMTSFIFLQQNVHAELHYATQVHNAPQTRSNLASQDASL